jgi:hypothetical protein
VENVPVLDDLAFLVEPEDVDGLRLAARAGRT